MRLLIVEDEKNLCDTVAKSLYDKGYEVDTCYDGDEALEYILAEDYDLIVLDLNLPGMDGMDILNSGRKMRIQRFLYYLQEVRLQIRLRGWMPEQMIIWKNHFICRSWRHVSEVLRDVNLYSRMFV